MEPNEQVLNDEVESVETETPEIEQETVAEEKQTPEPEPEQESDFESVDPTKLPPELQKIYKGFQSSYTKKMQSLTEAVNGLSPHRERLALLDRAINGDMEARSHLARIAGQTAQPQQQQQQEQFPEQFEDTKSLVSYMDQRVNAMLQNTLRQMLPQVLQPVQQMQQQAALAEVNAEIDRMKTTYPDFERHTDKMIQLKQEMPGLTLEAAYKLASYRAAVAPNKLISKPGVKHSAVTSKEPDGPVSWDQAYKLALKHQK